MKSVWSERDNQAFKSRFSNETTNIIRNGISINAHTVEGTVNRFHVSDKSTIHKPKVLHEIDTTLTDTYKALGIEHEKNLPELFVLGSSEMSASTIASYNPIKNQLFLREELFNGTDISLIQKDSVFPDNRLSTTIHEMIHWQDAEQFRKAGGVFSSFEVYESYCAKLERKAKKAIDRAGVTEYNVGELGKYAEDKYNEGGYNETYTELRTARILERLINKGEYATLLKWINLGKYTSHTKRVIILMKTHQPKLLRLGKNFIGCYMR